MMKQNQIKKSVYPFSYNPGQPGSIWPPFEQIRATTILAVRKNGQAVMAGDGQVSLGEIIMKRTAVKVRFMYKDRVLVGFAGAAADAFSLYEKLEAKLESYKGNLTRAAVELAKDWRTDRILRKLEALILAMDLEHTFIISGTGDVIEPDEPVAAIGSGGPYALAAARASRQRALLATDCKYESRVRRFKASRARSGVSSFSAMVSKEIRTRISVCP